MKTLTKRQKTRKIITIVSFLLFPVIFFYLSPYLPIEAPVMDNTINGSLMTFAAMFMLSIIFSRLWCGWICPMSGLGEICNEVLKIKPVKRKLYFLKWIFFIPWLACVIYFLIRTILGGNILHFDYLYMTRYGVSGVHLEDFADRIIPFTAYYFVLFLNLLLPLLMGKKAFCRTICWMAPFMISGKMIGKLLRLPQLKLKGDDAHCIQCKLCDSRCSMSINVSEMIRQKQLDHPECISCGECVDICPKNCLSLKISR